MYLKLLKMHHLNYYELLINKELANVKVGDLSTVPNHVFITSLHEIMNSVNNTLNSVKYVYNSQDRGLVELLSTGTTNLDEDGDINEVSDILIILLKFCIHYNKVPNYIGELPSFNKVSSDIISCLFLNHNKKEVMRSVMPVAVKYFKQENGILSKKMITYFSLAAIYNFQFLPYDMQTLMICITSGNYALCRVLREIYFEGTSDYFDDHTRIFTSILKLCKPTEKLTLFQLFSLFTYNKPYVFKFCKSQFYEFLNTKETRMATLQNLLLISQSHPQIVYHYIPNILKLPDKKPKQYSIIGQIYSSLAQLNLFFARGALDYIFIYSAKMDKRGQIRMMSAIVMMCVTYPVLFTDEILEMAEERSKLFNCDIYEIPILISGNQSSNGIDTLRTTQTNNEVDPRCNENVFNKIVQKRRLISHYRGFGGLQSLHFQCRIATPGNEVGSIGYSQNNTPEPSFNSLHTLHLSHDDYSITITRSCEIKFSQIVPYPHGTYFKYPVVANTVSKSSSFASCLGNAFSRHLKSIKKTLYGSSLCRRSKSAKNSKYDSNFDSAEYDSDDDEYSYSPVTLPQDYDRRVMQPYIVYKNTGEYIPRKRFTNTINRYCNAHLISIKAYMELISVKLPFPIKYEVEERNSKRSIKVSFGCEDQGRHCLHDQNLFNIHTQYPHLWIHIIFLDIQSNARLTALNANERAISDLKECWDELKHTNISFRELTQSEFPNDDDLKKILNELCYFGYFDLFDHCILNKTGIKWCCILCNRPKHVAKFIQNSIPLIEDELLEKNGHWVSLKQWKIQNFILYTTRLVYKISKRKKDEEKTLINANQIYALKVIRDEKLEAMAFELRTTLGTFTFKHDDKEKLYNWIKSLSVVIAYSRTGKNF